MSSGIRREQQQLIATRLQAARKRLQHLWVEVILQVGRGHGVGQACRIASDTVSRSCSAGPGDWRCIAMRHGRCAHTFFSAIPLAVTVTVLLGQ
jgi:hypothetical protein